MKRFILTTTFLAIAATAQADIRVTFNEGAPKDRFTFANIGSCAIATASLTLDLANSAGKLVFDVTDQGAGVEVFQPFELVAGNGIVTGNSAVRDGDNSLSLNISGLKPEGTIAFTIDVDDTLGAREITVNDSEISGAIASISLASGSASAMFDGNTALIDLPCAS